MQPTAVLVFSFLFSFFNDKTSRRFLYCSQGKEKWTLLKDGLGKKNTDIKGFFLQLNCVSVHDS